MWPRADSCRPRSGHVLEACLRRCPLLLMVTFGRWPSSTIAPKGRRSRSVRSGCGPRTNFLAQIGKRVSNTKRYSEAFKQAGLKTSIVAAVLRIRKQVIQLGRRASCPFGPPQSGRCLVARDLEAIPEICADPPTDIPAACAAWRIRPFPHSPFPESEDRPKSSRNKTRAADRDRNTHAPAAEGPPAAGSHWPVVPRQPASYARGEPSGCYPADYPVVT
jgi:hypothetical protein